MCACPVTAVYLLCLTLVSVPAVGVGVCVGDFALCPKQQQRIYACLCGGSAFSAF